MGSTSVDTLDRIEHDMVGGTVGSSDRPAPPMGRCSPCSRNLVQLVAINIGAPSIGGGDRSPLLQTENNAFGHDHGHSLTQTGRAGLEVEGAHPEKDEVGHVGTRESKEIH
jgi:hypothetical protein